jgi:hypothetical protein
MPETRADLRCTHFCGALKRGGHVDPSSHERIGRRLSNGRDTLAVVRGFVAHTIARLARREAISALKSVAIAPSRSRPSEAA